VVAKDGDGCANVPADQVAGREGFVEVKTESMAHEESAMPDTIYLHRQPDGSFVDWGRLTPKPYHGTGGVRVYMREAAKVMELVVKSSERGSDAG
jgi:hypothetical protein